MNLFETQHRLTQSLHSGDNPAQQDDVLHLLQPNDRIPPQLALAIYRNNYQGALSQALAAAYPACRRILGERCFNSLARRYVERTPSTQQDLNLYGAAFGDYLDDSTANRATLADLTYLGDLARLEWLCHSAYYAADDAAFKFEVLARVSPEAQGRLCFHTSHSLGLLSSDYPVMAIRDMNLSADPAKQVNTDQQPQYLVVSRTAYHVAVTRVDAVTFDLLLACRTGQSLADISASGTGQDEVSTTLPTLIARGWICGFSIGSADSERETAHA